MNEERVTYFAETDARNKKIAFGIKAKDRTKHVYVIGKTGMGKSTLLENMAVQDIKNGEGMAFIDPHGKTADLLLEYIPEERIGDVVYFAPFDMDYPISFNVLESVDADKRHLVVSGLMSTFKKIWQDAWSARMEYILTNTLLALLEYPDATLLGVNRMLSDKEYRKKVISHVTDPSVRSFWVDEFANYTERMAAEAVPAIQNKIGQFTANALIRNMIGQAKSSFDIRKLMDERKILIVNLSKGRIGETNANLLGGMLITKIYLAALSRADVPDRVLKGLPNFYLFVDEFQSFANESFADILSEARKYKLNLTMAHQYIEQMEEEVRAAVFGNVGTMIVFRVGSYDAEVLEKEFAPEFTAEDIVNLGFAQIYLKLMIDGISSHPFSATTLPPIPQQDNSNVNKVIEMSRKQFASNREQIEKDIADWHAPIAPAHKPRPTEMKHEFRPEQRPEQKPEHRVEHRSEQRPESKVEQKVEHKQEHHIEHKVEHKQVPLAHLGHHGHGHSHNNIKEATPEKVSELRNALASVLGKSTERRDTERPKEEKKEEKVGIEVPKVENRGEMKEVSGDILKEVLKTD
ncbi:MAG TPA: type IV secretory system conjugative DNA transfer family protein [Candidatus Paceibacterota bacterium]